MRPFQPPPLTAQIKAKLETIQAWLPEARTPLYLEIGCGVGLHPILMSQKNPSSHLLAFERTRSKFEKALGRWQNHGQPTNLFLCHGDAHFYTHHLFGDHTQRYVNGIFIFYPNPYPKLKQSNLRLAQMPFFYDLASILKPDGFIQITSNIKSYLDEIVDHVQKKPVWSLKSLQKIAPGSSPRTHFEKKYLARGEPCYELILQPSRAL